MVPTANEEPELCDDVKLVTPQLSADEGASHVTAALHAPASLFAVRSPGMSLMVGAWLSTTVMVKLAVVTLL